MSKSNLPAAGTRLTAPRPGDAYFGGRLVWFRSHAGLVLSEVEYPATRRCPRHAHASAFLALLLHGSYEERSGRTRSALRPLDLGFYPQDVVHEDEIGAARARFFLVEISPERMAHLENCLPRRLSQPAICNGQAAWLAARLYHERGCGSPLLFESLTAEMLATLALRPEEEEKSSPRWLSTVLDLLREEFSSKLTLERIAREVDLHPVYVSRTFRKFCGEGLGERLRRVRVGFAFQRLADREASLAQIALEAGFSDQSQFTKAFRRQTGMTPGAMRQSLTRGKN